MIEILKKPYEIDEHLIVIGASIGIAFAPQDGLDVDQLLKWADLALYRAKSDGRGVYRLFHREMDARIQARRGMESDLHQALHCGQLELYYQPIIDLRSRRVVGFEALLRWQHPTRGVVSPSEFIPLAEETGLIVPIGEWVLRQACFAATHWPAELKVAVNLSAVQFKNRNLYDVTIAALRESGLRPDRLEFEITETVMLHHVDATLTTLRQFRELGVHFAMDDFGTGYSSLSYLRRFPFDRIKIDQTFVRDLGEQADSMAIVRAVSALGNDLGMSITAEGVETWQQLWALQQAGCTEVQGYLFSRPVPGDKVGDVLQKLSIAEDAWEHSNAGSAACQIAASEALPAI
jgi:predicted signal transduction protein with EAL and GGDEF domain